nr:hypothetical protein [Escherichia coli]
MAKKCGYNSTSYFISTFKEFYGLHHLIIQGEQIKSSKDE